MNWSKRIAYIVGGFMACSVLVFNPVILGWLTGPVLMSVAPGADTSQTDQPLVNYYSSILVPGALYFGKRLIDWFFDVKLGGAA